MVVILLIFGIDEDSRASSETNRAALLVRYDFDMFDDHSRGHVSELQLAPLVNFALPHSWFLNLYPGQRHQDQSRQAEAGRQKMESRLGFF